MNVSADEEGSWVLVDTYEYPYEESINKADWSFYSKMEKNTIELQRSIPYDLGAYNSHNYDNPVNLHAKYTWSNPPAEIKPKETVKITLEQEVISNNTGEYAVGFDPYLKMDVADLDLGKGTASNVDATVIYSDGTKASKLGVGRKKDEKSQQSFTAEMSLQFAGNGTKGKKYALYFGVTGSSEILGVCYTYEWKQAETVSQTAAITSADWGKYSWEGEWDSNWGKMVLTQTGGAVAGTYTWDKGRITGTVAGNMLIGTWAETPSYAPNKDAGAIEFTMSEDGKTFTGKWCYGSSGSWSGWEGTKRITAVLPAPKVTASMPRNNIILQINNPNMSSNGKLTTLDSAPILHNDRTVLPIRAVAEAMGGTVGWDNSTRKVTISVNGTIIEMWLDKNTINVSGQSKAIDVAPTTINDRTMVPVRFVADNIPGCSIQWNDDTQSAIISY